MREWIMSHLFCSAAVSAMGFILQALLLYAFKRSAARLKAAAWLILPAALLLLPLVPSRGEGESGPWGPIFIVWLCGAVAFFSSFLIRQAAVYKKLSKEKAQADEKLGEMAGRMSLRAPRLFFTGGRKSPFSTFGTLVLPEEGLGEREKLLIFRQGLLHMKRGDFIALFITRLAQAFHWFNPAVTVFLAQSVLAACEDACREAVRLGLNREDAALYDALTARFRAKNEKKPPFAFN